MMHEPNGYLSFFMGPFQWAASVFAVVIGYLSGGDTPDVGGQIETRREASRGPKPTDNGCQGSNTDATDSTSGGTPSQHIGEQAARPVSNARERTQGVNNEMPCPESDALRETARKLQQHSSQEFGMLRQKIDQRIEQLQQKGTQK